jgi:hypothetical protein
MPTEPDRTTTATLRRSEPYTLDEFKDALWPLSDAANQEKPTTESVFGDDAGAVTRDFQRLTGESVEATAYVLMGIIIGTEMAEARRDR